MFKYVIRLREFQLDSPNWWSPILNELTDTGELPKVYKFINIPAFLINLNEDQRRYIETKYGALVEVILNK